ncbi:hypothetical protein QYF36_002353 [Acer negundo]|nr:hypothetical protein QYF36_002353 [Acer negundo]
MSPRYICDACKDFIQGISLGYAAKCNFSILVTCKNLLTLPLKHKCHKHNLYCAMEKQFDNSLKQWYCKKCKHRIYLDSIYQCVECDVCFHIECIPLPIVVKHKCHKHLLTFTRYKYGKLGLGVCKTELGPVNFAYRCEECTYSAHVECMISKGDDAWQDSQARRDALSFDTKNESEKDMKNDLEKLSLVE